MSYQTLTQCLDDDQRLIPVELYMQNRQGYEIYDRIVDIVYLFRSDDGQLDWASMSNIDLVLKRFNGVILCPLLLVTIRTPWSKHPMETIITREELDSEGYYERYRVLDVILRVRNRRRPNITRMLNSLVYQFARDEWDVIEVMYNVVLRSADVFESELTDWSCSFANRKEKNHET